MGLTWRAALATSLGLAACRAPITALPAPEPVRSVASEPVVDVAPESSAIRARGEYRVEAVLTGLTYPSSIAMDDQGDLFVAEAGSVHGDAIGLPRILRVSPDGDVRVLTDRLCAPVSDLLWRDGQLYVSHRGRISTVGPDGAVRDIVTGLPSLGIHQNTQLAFGPDGKLYFGQGTVTNSGVVGIDDFLDGWLAQAPDAHDAPAHDIHVADGTFKSMNPFLTAGGQGPQTIETSPFAAFGHALEDTDEAEGTLVVADARPSGCIYRCDPDGGALEVYAWGLADPSGVVWGNDGQLYAAVNGMDERGSRPIAHAPDELCLIKQDGWYGWPDFAGGVPVTDPRFRPSFGAAPAPLLVQHPPVEQPLLTLEPRTGLAKLATPPAQGWGDPRALFMAIPGDIAPTAGARSASRAPRVVRIDPLNRRVETFLSNLDEGVIDQGLGRARAAAGLRHPVDVVFSPRGDALYIADLGRIEPQATRLPSIRPYPGSGVVWRIVPADVQQVAPPAGLIVGPAPVESGQAGK
jgi:glucose/arabinose dehydrogenase